MTGMGVIIRCTSAETGGEAGGGAGFPPPGAGRTPGEGVAQERRFEVVHGTLTFARDGSTHVVRAGERLTVPAGSEYGLRSTGSQPAQFVCEIRPALDFETRVGDLFNTHGRSM